MERVNPIKHVGVALVLILLSIAGAIIGIQLITTIGVTPNTAGAYSAAGIPPLSFD